MKNSGHPNDFRGKRGFPSLWSNSKFSGFQLLQLILQIKDKKIKKEMFKVFLAFLGLIRLSYQHARLMEPPSRASMWRVGFPTPKDIDDNQNYCGGFGVQFGQNGGKCGICGDPWHDFPREHEAPDGIYATGKLIKNKLFAQCLKIAKKVAFNIASEASYVYILSLQKFIKKSQT